jgi:Cft2 family RNA processing exonuclease
MFAPMFSLAQKSLYVAALDLWIDSMRMRSRCYVSHGHSDHARPHETIVTTPHNAEVCKVRLGARGRPKRQATLLPAPEPAAVRYETYAYNEPWREGEHRLTLFSAGHVLGSAQLMIEGESGSFVYTGDFKLGRAYTCEPAEVKRCDVVLMECTYGRPQYVFPSRDEVEDAMIAFAATALADGRAPIFYAYSLGKAQEAMAILGKAGIPLTTHGAVYNIAQVYEACGVKLPPYAKYDATVYDGTSALIWPPSGKALPTALRGKPTRSAVLTGWALNRGATYASGADAAFALSDHADFPALLRYLELAQPRKVLLNHGWKDFVWRLRRMGIDAEYLEEHQQLALF